MLHHPALRDSIWPLKPKYIQMEIKDYRGFRKLNFSIINYVNILNHILCISQFIYLQIYK